MKNSRIIVLGASGYTGQIICSQLNSSKIKFSIAGRQLDKLSIVQNKNPFCYQTIEAKLDSDCDVEFQKIENFDIYINCIGPFLLFSKNITKYLSQKKCIYMDITGEQGFLKYSLDKLANNIKKNNSLFIHSNSFESSLVLLLANEVCDKELEYQSINSFYGFKSGTPSPGTRATMKIHHYFDQFITRNYSLTKVDESVEFMNVHFRGWKAESVGYFTPFPEVIFLQETYNVCDVGSYTLMPRFDAEMTKQMEKNSKKGNLEKVITKLAKSKYTGPDHEERCNHEFFIGLKAVTKKGSVKYIELTGRDMYYLTAAIMVEGVKFLMDHSSLNPGIFPISEVVDSKAFLNNLSEMNGLTIVQY
jgi:short subunit dehydrogenase-like uncharacterized protein